MDIIDLNSLKKKKFQCMGEYYSDIIYIKNWLVSWSNDKKLSSGIDTIDLNSLLKKKKKFQCVGECYSDITVKYECVNFMSHEDIAIWFICCSQVGVGDGW